MKRSGRSQYRWKARRLQRRLAVAMATGQATPRHSFAASARFLARLPISTGHHPRGCERRAGVLRGAVARRARIGCPRTAAGRASRSEWRYSYSRILAGNQKRASIVGLGLLSPNRHDVLPAKFQANRLAWVQEEVAKETYGLDQVRFAQSATTDQYRHRVQFKVKLADALEISYSNPLDHRCLGGGSLTWPGWPSKKLAKRSRPRLHHTRFLRSAVRSGQRLRIGPDAAPRGRHA